LSFQHLNLIEPLLRALNDEGYTTPTPIQEQAIPILLERKDLLGCAQTGTGKTAAFALPLLQLMCEDAANLGEFAQDFSGHRGGPRPIRALILTPTRELAIQIDESFGAYGRHTGLRHLVIFGGVPQHAQVQALRAGTDILVATPGRLLDLCDQKLLSLKDIRYFVLDEADRMLDMGFIHDVRKIIAKLPAKRHSLFFSATMPPEIQKLSGSILVNPSKVEVTPASTTAETVQQSIYFVDKKDKRSLLLHVLKGSAIETALVFTRTKHGADKVAQGLSRAGIRAEAIHGNKSQNARQRALENFKSRQTRILVATDIAARGIDIDELTHVINFEMPNVPETYVHRIGRTGRAGASGTALSFCDLDEKEFLRDIQKLIARQIPVVEDHPHVLYGGISADAPAAAANSNGNGHGGRNNAGGRGNNDGQRRGGQQSGGMRRDNRGNGNGNSGRGNGSNGGRGNNGNGGNVGRGNNSGSQRNNPSLGRPPRREPRPGGSQPTERPDDAWQQSYLGDEPAPWERNEPIPPAERGQSPGQGPSTERVQSTGQGQQEQQNGSADKRRTEPQRDRQPQGHTEPQRDGQPQGRTGGRPDGRRNPSDPAARPKPPRKNAAELKMPEQKKDYKDPLEDIEFKINRSEGDEKW
jgi:ATP-dependent RNA helicase RhlE